MCMRPRMQLASDLESQQQAVPCMHVRVHAPALAQLGL